MMEDNDETFEAHNPEPISSKNLRIHRRVGHVTVKYKNFIVVWGGYEDEEKHNVEEYFRTPQYHPPDQVLLFDVDYEIWHSVRTCGSAPPKLCGSTAAVSGDSMFLFGGFLEEPEQESPNVRSLYELNLLQMRWRRLYPAGVPPLPCDKLVSWCYRQTFYVLGGFGPWPEAGPAEYAGLRVASLPGEERCWNGQLVCLEPAAGRWHWPQTEGERPSPRAAHAAALLDCRLFVFGGRMGRRLNDLHCLHLESLRWSRLEPASGPVPQGRSWHSLTAISDHQLLLYGGFNDMNEPLADPWIWDTVCRLWSRCCWLAGPPVRMWHAAAPGHRGEALLVGGLASSIFSPQPIYAAHTVAVRRTPKSLLRLCLDAVEEHRAALTPDVWLLPPPMVDRVMARLAAAGSRLLQQ